MKQRKHLNFSSMRKQFSEIIIKNGNDSRQGGKINYSQHDVVMSAFGCMFFQDPSLVAFQRRLEESCQRNNLSSILGVTAIPKDTQMRSILDNFDSDIFRLVFKDLFSILQRAKLVKEYDIFPNTYYVPFDATQYFSSHNIHCDNCLVTEHSNGDISYSHKALMAAILNPDIRQVIPLMPEEICNSDGNIKQDCEINAAKRLLYKIKKDHPKLKLIIGGDDIYSREPFITQVIDIGYHYLFVAKESSHPVMYAYLKNAYLNKKQFIDKKGKKHCYEWINDVPLNGNKAGVKVNFFSYKIISVDKNGNEKINYHNSWVTDIKINEKNVEKLTRTARSRWKIENECFNTLKNQGYNIEHNYGHGQKHLSFNFFILTLLAFFFHQIFELADKYFQAARKKFGSKRELWSVLRTYIRIIVFDSWEHLLDFALTPNKYNPNISKPG